jgi:hypothetical protein
MSKQFMLDQINAYYDFKEAAELQKIEEFEAAQWGINLPQSLNVQAQVQDVVQEPLLAQEMIQGISSLDTELQNIEEFEAAQWGINLPQPVIVQQMQALDVVQEPLLTQEMIQEISSLGLEIPQQFTLGSGTLEDFLHYCIENPSVQTELMADIVTNYL